MQKLAAQLFDRFRLIEGVDVGSVAMFLANLRIDSDAPPARYQRVVDIENFVQPTLTELRLDSSTAADAYDAVLRLVRSAAEACGEKRKGWLLSPLGALDHDTKLKVDVGRRMIGRDQVLSALQQVAVSASAALPPPTPGTSRLVRKLKAGDMVPTVTAAARRARRSWTEYERGSSPPLPGKTYGLDLSDLRARVVSEAVDAQLRAHQRGTPYGDRMLADLRERVAALARDLPGLYRLDGHLLMGLVYDLTARCEIWWSDEFDPDVEIREGTA